MRASAPDPFGLARFTAAQEPVWEAVREELAAGRKRSHWMWFVFPQVAGLGRSAMARRYAIGSRGEARAYLAHPELGARLVKATRLMLAHSSQPLRTILGTPDDSKFVSSMTLFDAVAEDVSPFSSALDTWCGGMRDPATLAILSAWDGPA